MKPDIPHQLELFARSEASSTRSSPRSPPSNERSTSSSEPTKPSEPGATSTTSTARAQVRSTLGLAGRAATSCGDASSTEASEPRHTQLTLIAKSTPDPMYLIARPTNRAQCRPFAEERRAGNPCPWAGCKYHLLLDVTHGKPRQGRDARPTSIRLNSPARRSTGRRPGLRSSADEAQVRVWLDDAMELLFSMRFTCALDVIDRYPDGISVTNIGSLLGTTRQAVEEGLRKPHIADALRKAKEIFDE